MPSPHDQIQLPSKTFTSNNSLPLPVHNSTTLYPSSYHCDGNSNSSSYLNGNDPVAESTVSLKNKVLLGLLNFTTLNRARPGIFVAPYLLMRGWNESQIGWLYFLNCILSLVIQTPAGSFADSTSYKRTMVSFSNLTIALMCLVLIYFSDIWVAVVLALAFLGVGYTIAYPAVYSMTLGIVGPEGIMEQVPINETSIHAGNAFFAILSGFVVYYMNAGDTIFYICIAMALFTILLLGLFDPDSISTDRARGILPAASTAISTSDIPPPEPIPLSLVMFDRKVLIFFCSIMFFHLSNASMLPLLAQILFVKGDHGFEFSCLCVAVAQLTMILSASFAGYYVRYIGTKQLFLLSFLFLPMRGITLMILLWNPDPDPFILVSTQILDGAAGGLFGVISVLIAENLSRGTGHFSVIVSTIKTVESLGAAFSSLCGEQLAEVVNYSVAFGVLSVIAILPIVIYGCYMPSGSRDVFTGEMVELLSVLDQSPPSSSCLPYSSTVGRTSIDSSSSSVDIDSSRTRLTSATSSSCSSSSSYGRHPQRHQQQQQSLQVDEENPLAERQRRKQQESSELSDDSSHTATRHIKDSLSEM